MWKIEKVSEQNGGNDLALCIRGYWVFSLIYDKNYKSLIIFNYILWDKVH